MTATFRRHPEPIVKHLSVTAHAAARGGGATRAGPLGLGKRAAVVLPANEAAVFEVVSRLVCWLLLLGFMGQGLVALSRPTGAMKAEGS